MVSTVDRLSGSADQRPGADRRCVRGRQAAVVREFVRRWWMFGAVPLGVFLGWASRRVGLPPFIVGLFVVAATLIWAGILHWRFIVWKRRAQEELVEALAFLPVYLTSDLWHLATKHGLISPDVLVRAHKKQAERRAAERVEEDRL